MSRAEYWTYGQRAHREALCEENRSLRQINSGNPSTRLSSLFLKHTSEYDHGSGLSYTGSVTIASTSWVQAPATLILVCLVGLIGVVVLLMSVRRLRRLGRPPQLPGPPQSPHHESDPWIEAGRRLSEERKGDHSP